MKPIVTLLTLMLFAGMSLPPNGCGSTLEPVSERARAPLSATPTQPKVVWVVDRSGSMASPVNPSDPSCRNGATLCGPSSPCSASCRTRFQMVAEGLDLMAPAVSTLPQELVLFPETSAGDSCGAPTGATPLTGSVAATVRSTLAGGGTPTAAALQVVASKPVTPGEQTFVVVVTDGVPNCNAQNPNALCGALSGGPSAAQLAACKCVQPTGCASSALCSIGCADDIATTSAIAALEASGRHVLVLTLGEELGASGAPFAGMPVSLAPRCTEDAECHAGSCLDGLCSSRAYFAAQSGDFELAAVRLSEATERAAACTFVLSREVTGDALQVEVGSQELSPEAYTVSTASGASTVVVEGTACDQLRAGATASFTERPTE